MVQCPGWVNRNQQNAIEYLQEEVKVLKEQLGKKPRFNDDQRRRLAVKAKKLGLAGLRQLAAIATPRTLLAWRWQRQAVTGPAADAERSARPYPENGGPEPHLGLYAHSRRTPEPGVGSENSVAGQSD